MFGSVFSGCGCGSSSSSSSTPKFYDGNPVSYEYTYDVCMAFPAHWYKVFTREDGTVCLAYTDGGPEATILRAPKDILETIGKMVRDNKLYKLSSSYTPPFEVMDGYGWHLEIGYDGDSLWSGGNNARPEEKLWEGIQAINKYLDGIIEASSEKDVLGHQGYRELRG